MKEAIRIVVATLLGAFVIALAIALPLSLYEQAGDPSRGALDLAAGVALVSVLFWTLGVWNVGLALAAGWYLAWRFAFAATAGPVRRHLHAAWTGAALATAFVAVRAGPPGPETLLLALATFAAASFCVLVWGVLFLRAARREAASRADGSGGHSSRCVDDG